MTAAPALIGASPQMQALHSAIASAADSQARVLLTGETGVGKEVVAQLIHARSARRTRPFVTLNCAGMPDTLLESEFFGHVRGSFTDAYTDKPGVLRQADTGTILLDEVGEMSLRMQVLLLRFLETGEVETVGGTAARTRVDVRVIAATNRDLGRAVAADEFRHDLYYRLNVLRVTIPPLRERGADVELLVRHYLAHHATEYHVPAPELTPGALDVLMQYEWPGNVRELRNVVERLVLRVSEPTIDADAVVAAITHGESPAGLAMPSKRPTVSARLKQITEGKRSFWSVVHEPFMAHDLTRDELRLIVAAGLEQAGGNVRTLLQLFNMPPIDHKRFLAMLKQHDCDVRRSGICATS